MISPALQNLLDRAKALRDHSDGLRFEYAKQITTALELVVKKSEMLREALGNIVRESNSVGAPNSFNATTAKEALAECAKIDEQIAKLK